MNIRNYKNQNFNITEDNSFHIFRNARLGYCLGILRET